MIRSVTERAQEGINYRPSSSWQRRNFLCRAEWRA